MTIETCPECGAVHPEETPCPRLHFLGPHLHKAVFDHFDYVLKLRTGELIRFQLAEQVGEWLMLTFWDDAAGIPNGLPYPCPRGIQVRLTDVVWCADAPNGS